MPVVERIQALGSFAFAGRQFAVPPFIAGERQDSFTPGARLRWCAAVLMATDVVAFIVATVAAIALDHHILGKPWLVMHAARAGAMGGANLMWAGHGGTHAAVWVALGCCVLAGIVGYVSMHEHYRHRVPFWTESRDLVMASAVALVAACSAAFLLDLSLPRAVPVMTAMVFPPLVMIGRRVARTVLERCGVWRLPVLVVGDGSWAEQVEALLGAHQELGYQVVGRICPPASLAGGQVWTRQLQRHGAAMLILAADIDRRPDPALLASLVRERVPYSLLPEQDGLPVVGARHTLLNHEAVLVSYRNNLEKPVARGIKMAFDLVMAGLAILVLAPVMLVIACLVGADGGPILFAHQRVGVRGQTFNCLKFRSMVVDADAVLQHVLATDPAAAEEWRQTHKLRRDPRVTWIGRLLRKTSLDELPQLFNVLRLEMSLVGPRPIVSLEIPKYADDIAYYYETRPGITGLWQVSGRSDTTYAQRVRLDAWYVKNWTIWQDLAIIARTIPAVVSGRGAG
jgi:undecaprenyl-phosphate galactose phosphotransferase